MQAVQVATAAGLIAVDDVRSFGGGDATNNVSDARASTRRASRLPLAYTSHAGQASFQHAFQLLSSLRLPALYLVGHVTRIPPFGSFEPVVVCMCDSHTAVPTREVQEEGDGEDPY